MSKKYTQGYLKSWEKDPQLKDWIACDAKSESRAFCKYCKCSLKAHKKDLILHGKSLKHTREVSSSLQVKSMRPLNVIIQKPVELKIAELKLSTFIAEHSSMNCMDHLSQLIPILDPTSTILSNIRLHRTKCTMLIKNVIGPCMLECLVEDVGDSNYSLIIDESTDVSTFKTLCLIIKYFSKEQGKIFTIFYRIVVLEDYTAQGIYKTITSQLEKDKLPLKNLIGIGTDGANVMIGAHSSVSVLLQADVPDLIVVKCVCHSLHLCAEKACKELPRQLEFLIRECHNYFSLSSKRLRDYKTFCGLTRTQSVRKIPKLAGTRWLARESAVDVVLDQWDELLNFFKIAVAEDKCYSAEQLVNIMNIPAHKALLVFLKHSLSVICKTNRLFQSSNIDILLLFQDLIILYKSFLKKIVVPTQLEKIPDHQLISFSFLQHLAHVDSIYLGHEFEVLANKLTANDRNDVRKRCVNFTIAFCIQLQQRLPTNLDILGKINCFRPEVCTAQKKPEITDIVSQFKRFKITECEEEWRNLSVKQWGEIGDVNDFWAMVYSDKDSAGNRRFENILTLLSLPISNAFVERAFSIYNTVKSKLRNKLSVDTVQSILMIRYYLKKEQLTCINFKPSKKMIALFTQHMYDHVNATDTEINGILDEIDLRCLYEES